MHTIVIAPVLIFFFYTPAYFEHKIRSYSHITQIEQAVNISPHQKTISDLMLTSLTVGQDMGGVEGREGYVRR